MNVPAAREVVEYANRLGWRRALVRSAYVGVNQVADVSCLDCFTLGREDIVASLATPPNGFECRFLAPGEASAFTGRCDAVIAEILKEGAARGDDTYVILEGQRVVSIGLYAVRPTPVLKDLMVHFEPPARYMYRGYTEAAYRGQRLHALGILRAGLELFDRGVPRLVTVCERTNYPATISVLRMGWRPSGAVYRIGVGPWARLGRTAAAAAIGMELRKK